MTAHPHEPMSEREVEEALRLIHEALEYQERESLVGPLFPEAIEALLALQARLRESERAAAGLNADLSVFGCNLQAAEQERDRLRAAAKNARSVAAAPDYDEEAIRDALWRVVDLALAPEAEA